MRKAWNICSAEIGLILKKRRSYLTMFAMPLLFTLLFGNILGGDGGSQKLKILLVDQDGTFLSKELGRELRKDNPYFTLEKSTSAQAEKMLENKKAEGMIKIPKDFEEKLKAEQDPAISFRKIPEFTSSGTVTGSLSASLTKMKMNLAASNAWSRYSGGDVREMYGKLANETKDPSQKIERITVYDHQNDNQPSKISASASGMSIMFVMIVMMSVTGTILEARNNGVWHRLLIAPAKRASIASGYLLSFFILGWIQFGTLMVLTHYLFDVSWGNPLVLFIHVSAMLLAIVGLGLIIAGTARTAEQQSAFGNLLVISTCMISGVYWPLEIEPPFMQKIAEFLPQTWAMRGFNEISLNASILDNMHNVEVLLLFAAVFLVIGIRKIRI
ncbi:ABC transporter permease [Actinomycetes bacterium NPDC127524]